MSEYSFDGDITQTAMVHSLAWKRMSDACLRVREERYGEP